jgi:HAD superfamily hydrolase (TIGR01548 family)
MIERYARLSDAVVTRVPWLGDAWPIDGVLSAITDSTGVIALVSPNNPTGGVVTRSQLLAVAGAAPDSLVLLDHAYVEYSDEDLSAAALDLPNVLVVRTFSKAWGLAGCRVGYALGAEDVITLLRRAGAPYPVAGPSLALAAAQLASGQDDLARHVTCVRRERQELVDVLRSHGVTVRESQANFVLAEAGGRASLLHESLQALGVLVRAFPSRPELAGALRITLPGNDDGQRMLVAALETALAPQALLLDLDGVLADVEQSYRSCLLATAHSFGADLSREDLLAAVLEGDANNDWALTVRLLARRGITATLAEVTERYQRIYLGEEGRPGLRERERLLVARDVIARLARRLPLAVVTGRPRAEAEWFLEREELLPLLSALTCMEDGPVKPDPSPVRHALKRLGVDRAWMVGDTPDDARAALGAAVLPFGVVAPGDDPVRTRNALLASGAIRVLDSITDLESLLP